MIFLYIYTFSIIIFINYLFETIWSYSKLRNGSCQATSNYIWNVILMVDYLED